MTELRIAFTLNGEPCEVRTEAHRTLLEVLRARGGVEVKEGCGEGVCGTCTVLLDGEPVSSCLVLAARAHGRDLLTVRGLGDDQAPHPLQSAFVAHGAAQCGFCTPGMLLAAYALLRDHPRASRAEIRRAIAGNLCRCTGYTKIIDAIAACAGGAARG